MEEHIAALSLGGIPHHPLPEGKSQALILPFLLTVHSLHIRGVNQLRGDISEVVHDKSLERHYGGKGEREIDR